MRDFWFSEFHNMEGAVGCFIMALLLVTTVGGDNLVSEGDHHVREVSNLASKKSRDGDPKALTQKANDDQTTAAAELNPRTGDLCFLSEFLGYCRSDKKVKLPASSIRARSNAELVQKNLRSAISGSGTGTGGHGTSLPKGYKNHPVNPAAKKNGSSSTRLPSDLNFFVLVLGALFYSVYNYNFIKS